MVKARPLKNHVGGVISYDSVATPGGSSGSGILNGVMGEVVGAHQRRLYGFQRLQLLRIRRCSLRQHSASF